MLDIIVVGAGVEGLATAYTAAKRGLKTLLLEQYEWPHSYGGSQGQTRIIRRAHVGDLYAHMMDVAFKGWQDLEKETGTKLYINTGMLVFGLPSNPEMDIIAQSLGDRCVRLTAEEMRQRYPGFTPTDEFYGLYDAEGGILLADKALAAFMSQYQAMGGKFISGAKVTDVRTGPEGVQIETKNELYHAKSATLTMGPWTTVFVEKLSGIRIPVEAHETLMPYWKLNGKFDYSGSNFPVVLYNKGLEDDSVPYHFYFKPCIEFSSELNLGVHYGMKFDAGERPGSDKLKNRYLEITRKGWSRFLPGVAFDAPSALKGCVYTENVKDSDYVLDEVLPNVYIATGFSGTGFKMAPVIGDILVKMACGEATQHDISKFKISRFMNSRI